MACARSAGSICWYWAPGGKWTVPPICTTCEPGGITRGAPAGAPGAAAPTAAAEASVALAASAPGGGSGPTGARKDCTATSPAFRGGSCLWYVVSVQSLGESQIMRQLGFGQTAGSLQFHLQIGCSQTLWHDSCTPGQTRLQRGSSHLVWHSGQSRPGHERLEHTTEHRGRSHLILQLEVSGAPVHLVSHRGSSHWGSQVDSQLGDSHLQWQRGRQLPPPPPPPLAGGGGGAAPVGATDVDGGGPGTSWPAAGV
mmetsp:Transcript_105866/g.281970  ORF Transcript_105866/g.281970 Transcript_105866/m.281970 type:complete len:254 (+) Transcript_105866:170-931(+)